MYFFYNGKDHTTCFSCAESRKNRKNVCKECGIRARYNLPGETIGIYCKKHSSPDMIVVKSPKCISCKKKGISYGIPGKKATHCFACADKSIMINLKSYGHGFKNALYFIAQFNHFGFPLVKIVL